MKDLQYYVVLTKERGSFACAIIDELRALAGTAGFVVGLNGLFIYEGGDSRGRLRHANGN